MSGDTDRLRRARHLTQTLLSCPLFIFGAEERRDILKSLPLPKGDQFSGWNRKSELGCGRPRKRDFPGVSSSLRNAPRHLPGAGALGPCISRLAEDPDGPRQTEPHFRVWKRSSEPLPGPAYGVSGRMRDARPPLRDRPNLPLNN